MKSKVKYAALVLVIGLLSLVILPSSVFGGKPESKLYTIVVSGAINSDGAFDTEGNKALTRFNPFPKGEEVSVTLTFDLKSLFPGKDDFDVFRTSPLPGVGLQELDGKKWEFHHIKISGNSLYCRFDLFYDEYVGAWDHYVLDIYLKLTNGGVPGTYQDENATINWTHYTENTKPRGKKPKIEFQQLEHKSHGSLTITIIPETG